MICQMLSPFTGQEIASVPLDVLTAWLARVDAKIAAGRVYREHQAATVAEVRRVLAECRREGSKVVKGEHNEG